MQGEQVSFLIMDIYIFPPERWPHSGLTIIDLFFSNIRSLGPYFLLIAQHPKKNEMQLAVLNEWDLNEGTSYEENQNN